MEIIEKNLDLKLPEVVIFDWDNTLVDAWPLIYKALNETFIKFGKSPWTLAETKINIHRALRELMPQFFGDKWEEAGEYYRKIYLENVNDIKPLNYSEEMLKTLKEYEIKAAIVSNKKAEIVRKELALMKWENYFQSILGSGDLEVDKPNPKTVEITLEQLVATKAKNIWFVGDSVTDMETAYASNTLPVFYGPEDFKNERYKDCYPKVHINNYNNFISFIKESNDSPQDI